nr:hypothetical protein [Mesoplasma seiffertii]
MDEINKEFLRLNLKDDFHVSFTVNEEITKELSRLDDKNKKRVIKEIKKIVENFCKLNLNIEGKIMTQNEFQVKVLSELKTISLRLLNVEQRLDKVEQRLDKVEQRLDKVEQRLDKVEQRLDRVEQHLDKVEQRLDRVEQRLDILEEDVKKLKADVKKLKAAVFK